MNNDEMITALNKLASAIYDIAHYQVGTIPMDMLSKIVGDMGEIMNNTYTGEQE